MDTGISIFHFNDKINFWLVRANGGNYFDDFINNDYIGIKYNRVTVSDLNKLKSKGDCKIVCVRMNDSLNLFL